MNKKKMVQFKEAFDFVNAHPAFTGEFGDRDPISNTMVVKVCKNGHALDDWHKWITIYEDNPRFSEFIDKVPEDRKRYHYKENLEEDRNNVFSIEVDYVDYYGYDWEFDHVEIWIEGGASRFFVECKNSGEPRWENWHDSELNSSGPTYEDAVIEFAKKVKEKYGNFSHWGKNEVVPTWVREYNRGKEPVFFEPVDGGKFFTMNHNKDYISVSSTEENEIWWQIWGKEHLPDMFETESWTLDVSHYIDYEKFKEKFSK
jgi:hypothetical protein